MLLSNKGVASHCLLYTSTNRWLQAIFQPLALLMVWGTVTRQIIVRLQLPARGVVVLALIYYLIMFAPLASEIGGDVYKRQAPF